MDIPGFGAFKQGRIADRGQEAQQFRASGLNLVIAAIVYWNSTYLADAVAAPARARRDTGRTARPHVAADLGAPCLLRKRRLTVTALSVQGSRELLDGEEEGLRARGYF